MRAFELLNENKLEWIKNPIIGWWLDNNPVRFYHGTHSRNIEGIMKNGIFAPISGPTADWVSLALEPNTAHGYASMSSAGGESEFRGAGDRAVTTPHHERTVFVLEIPQSYFLSKMASARGAMVDSRDKLTNKNRYEKWKKSGKTDQEYYQVTEIRLPKYIPSKYIIGYMNRTL